ncbi:hypothetical protein PHLGIDRAFT_313885 [Phlebiopsis gigantea 11061_1 CR5-6]|uniref:Uncharacterized protein n=1 Tax=Phlebiopsis gigantea (strain 11061_1 CR5-6) TaxID=745531 RepID=A0A0C3S2W2_PHLG1|nr:hypothetical protein PHLGIDRAFT_313885 [Phlebiopsis gigantea 11061_1 CR5-6]
MNNTVVGRKKIPFIPSNLLVGSTYMYKFPLFSTHNLPRGTHTFMVQNGWMGSGSSLIMLDGFIFTTETANDAASFTASSLSQMPVQSTQISPGRTPELSNPELMPATPPASHKHNLVVPLVATAIVIVVVVIVGVLYRYHQKRRRAWVPALVQNDRGHRLGEDSTVTGRSRPASGITVQREKPPSLQALQSSNLETPFSNNNRVSEELTNVPVLSEDITSYGTRELLALRSSIVPCISGHSRPQTYSASSVLSYRSETSRSHSPVDTGSLARQPSNATSATQSTLLPPSYHSNEWSSQNYTRKSSSCSLDAASMSSREGMPGTPLPAYCPARE